MALQTQQAEGNVIQVLEAHSTSLASMFAQMYLAVQEKLESAF